LIAAVEAEGRLADVVDTTYFTPGTILTHFGPFGAPDAVRIGDIPPRPGWILLERGDALVLTRDPSPGRPAERDASGGLVSAARVGCTLPEVFGHVRPGERIWFDDGRIGGVIKDVSSDEIVVEITVARSGGDKLRADRGINLPDSDLGLPALTAQDAEDLEFVARHADSVGFSFVRRPSDVAALRERLAGLDGEHVGIVLKIETRQAFEGLPDLLLAAMHGPFVGVMIARGDLAVECGYERLAEVQEEILWICEAAHVPVIWATQVLENLAKSGVPSRAEITDAAMGRRAECVMLNKGPHVREAVRALDDILGRMQGHQYKKTSMLRKLRLAELALHA
jgi:pyruvate kinase